MTAKFLCFDNHLEVNAMALLWYSFLLVRFGKCVRINQLINS